MKISICKHENQNCYTKINMLSKQSICRSTGKITKCQPFDQIDLRLFSLFLSYDLPQKIFRFPSPPHYLHFFKIFASVDRVRTKMVDRKHIENRTKLHWKIVRLSTCQQIIMRKSQVTLHKVSLFLLIVKCYKNDRLTVFCLQPLYFAWVNWTWWVFLFHVMAIENNVVIFSLL